MSFRLIQAIESDRPYLLALRKQTMTEHLERDGVFLSEAEHMERLNHQFDCCYIVWRQAKRIGALKYCSTVNDVEILQLQVAPQFQGRGYGTDIVSLLRDRHAGKLVRLSVLKTNPAFRLYQRLGFVTVAADEHEYQMQLQNV